MKPKHSGGYSPDHTLWCERTLITLLRGLGPYKRKVYLTGGLAPRYLTDSPHVGTSDVDLVLDLDGLAEVEAYRTLERNLLELGLERGQNDEGKPQNFRWVRRVRSGLTIVVDLLGPDGPAGKARPVPGESRLSTLGVPGAHLVVRDHLEVQLEVELLDEAGLSIESVQVAGLVPSIVLKALAYEDRAEQKDAYDLVHCLYHGPGGPEGVGELFNRRLLEWPDEPLLGRTLEILGRRFASPRHDGPTAYAQFLTDPGRPERNELLRQEAFEVCRLFIARADP